jgi:hypothetical protein
MSHRHVLASALSCATVASSASSSLSDSLFIVLHVLIDRPLDLKICSLADHIVSTRQELQEKKEARRTEEVRRGR